jgi:hypothetical protein
MASWFPGLSSAVRFDWLSREIAQASCVLMSNTSQTTTILSQPRRGRQINEKIWHKLMITRSAAAAH